jgi:hypothetical protein
VLPVLIRFAVGPREDAQAGLPGEPAISLWSADGPPAPDGRTRVSSTSADNHA